MQPLTSLYFELCRCYDCKIDLFYFVLYLCLLCTKSQVRILHARSGSSQRVKLCNNGDFFFFKRHTKTAKSESSPCGLFLELFI